MTVLVDTPIPTKTTPAQEAAATGAAFLDERFPGWAEQIDLERLDLEAGCDCVLGQLYCDLPGTRNGFAKGVAWLNIDFNEDGPDLIDLGFISGDDYQYPELTAAWKPEIEKRLV